MSQTHISARLDRSGQLLVGVDDFVVVMTRHMVRQNESPEIKQACHRIIQDVIAGLKQTAKKNPPPESP